MPELKNKSELETALVHENGSLIPAHQSVMSGGQDSYITIPATPSPASTILGSGKTYYLDLESDEVGRIDDLCLRFRVACSTADVDCVPTPYWFNRIVLEAEKGSGDELIHIYPENFVLWENIVQDRVGREKSAYMTNYQRTQIKSECAEKYWVSERTKFKAGETRDVYLPIPALFLHMNAIDMKHIRSDFRIRLEFGNDIVIQGDRNNLSLENLDVVIRTFSEEQFDFQDRMRRIRGNNHKYIYLDHEVLTYNDKTLTAGQTTRFALDQFVGRCPFIVCVIKSGTNPSASDKSIFTYNEVGDEATFDITNSGSQSLLGSGTAIKAPYLYEYFTKQTGNPHIQGVYLIPFCESVKKSFSGHLNGFFEFVGLKDYLEITFDTAPTQEVHTITTDSLGTTGSFRYCFESGVISDQELDYNDSASTIKTAIDAIPALQERNITVSVNDGLDATTSQTITYNANSGKVSQELGKISILGNGTPKVNNTALTTVAKKGWTSGNNYTVEIHMYKFRCLDVLKNGKLVAKDL